MGSLSVGRRVIILLVLPCVLYPLTLQRAFEAVDLDLRSMSPGIVWLLLISLVKIVWMFFVVNHLKATYTKMGAAGRLTAASDEDYGLAWQWPSVWLCRSSPSLAAWLPRPRWCSLDHPLGDREQGAGLEGGCPHRRSAALMSLRSTKCPSSVLPSVARVACQPLETSKCESSPLPC
jgi:hypothetical protein